MIMAVRVVRAFLRLSDSTEFFYSERQVVLEEGSESEMGFLTMRIRRGRQSFVFYLQGCKSTEEKNLRTENTKYISLLPRFVPIRLRAHCFSSSGVRSTLVGNSAVRPAARSFPNNRLPDCLASSLCVASPPLLARRHQKY